MKQWREKEGENATLENLENALKDVGRPDITENFKNLVYSSYGTTETVTVIKKTITRDEDGNVVDEKETKRETVTIAKDETYSPRPEDQKPSDFIPTRAKRESEGDDIQAASPKENGLPELGEDKPSEITADDVKVLSFDQDVFVEPEVAAESHEPPPEIEDVVVKDETVDVVTVEDTNESPPEVADIVIKDDIIDIVNIQENNEAPPEVLDIKGEEDIIHIETIEDAQDAPREISDINGTDDIIEVINVEDAHEAPPQVEDIVDEEIVNIVNIQDAHEAPRDVEDISSEDTVQVVNIEEVHEAPPPIDDLHPIEESVDAPVIITEEESAPETANQVIPSDDQNSHEVVVEEVNKDGLGDDEQGKLHMKRTTTTDKKVEETEDGTVTVTTKTITQQIKVERTVEGDEQGKEDLIKQMFAGEKGVLEFFGSDEPQVEEEDGETEI